MATPADTPSKPGPARASGTPGSPRSFTPPAPLLIIAGWVLPGLAHALIGEKSRGIIVGATVLALFIGGLLVGGIDVVDSRNDRLWFAGQVLAGPIALAVDYKHKSYDLTQGRAVRSSGPLAPNPDAELRDDSGRRLYDTSIGRMNELGTLYCALAGVLNLLIILDAIGREDDDEPVVAATSGADAKGAA